MSGEGWNFGLPVQMLGIGCGRMRNIVADQHEDVRCLGTPREFLRLMKYQFVAFGSITSARCLSMLNEVCNCCCIMCHIEVLCDIGLVWVAIISMRDNTDANTRQFLHQAIDRCLDFSADLGEDRIHASGRIKADHDINRVDGSCLHLLTLSSHIIVFLTLFTYSF